MQIKTIISFAAFTFILSISQSTIADNCSITNGVKVGKCDKVLSHLDIKSNISESGIISGATVRNGATLYFHGTCNGDISVSQGSKLLLYGSVNGEVINNGGVIEIHGYVKKLNNIFGNVYVDGIIENSSGVVQYKKGAIINGKEM
jgi:hypothetical protein